MILPNSLVLAYGDSMLQLNFLGRYGVRMCERGGEAHAAFARKLAGCDAPVAYLILVVKSNS